jgi:hypothetical protein
VSAAGVEAAIGKTFIRPRTPNRRRSWQVEREIVIAATPP